MLKSTAGTWVNYLTTALFQVLFARRFGSSSVASAYALTFTISVASTAIFVGTTQSVYIPRMLSRGGDLLTTVMRRMLKLSGAALVLFAGLAASAPLLAQVIGQKLDHLGTDLPGLIRLASLFGFSQVMVGQLAAVSWVRGGRFVPAVSPAIPSIVASVPLVTGGSVSISVLYGLLTAGSAVQIVVLGATTMFGARLSDEPLGSLRGLTIAFLIALAAAQLIAPFEVLIAAHSSSSGGAQFNYAYRTLAVTQALIVGGAVSAALPEWSRYVRLNARVTLERAIAQTLSVATLALALVAAIGVVASSVLVQVVFQRGAFTAHDTRAVSEIILASLVGFVAEGVMLVLAQALLADGRSRLAIKVGMARAGGVIVLASVLGFTNGPVGVAVGYSLANLIVVMGQLRYTYRIGLLTRHQSRLARSTMLVAVCTGLTAGGVLLLQAPSLLRIGVVLAVFMSLVLAVRDGLPTFRIPWTARLSAGASRMRPAASKLLRRDPRVPLAVATGAAVMGLAMGSHPTVVVLVLGVAGAAAFCAFAPVYYLPGILLAGTIVEPTLVFKGISGSGQAHLVLAVAVVAMMRLLIVRPRLELPGLFLLAIVAAIGLLLMTAVVATGQHDSQVGSISKLIRDLSFPFAAVVGLVGGARARASGRDMAVPRTFALLGIAASLACADYWLWVKGGLPPLSGSLFGNVKAASGFAASRSIFPWVEDAPNIAAVVFAMIAAFAGPPLLLSSARRDHALALLLLVTSIAAVLFTESRTGITAAATASLAYLVLVKRGGGGRSSVLITLIVAATISGYIFSTFPSNRQNSDTLVARTYVWGQATRSFLADPLIGHGYLYSQSNNFVDQSSPTGDTVSATVSTHSDVLSVLVDGGVVGLTIFVGILVLMVRAALRGFRDPRSIPIAIGFSCLLVAFLTGGIDNTLTQSAAAPTLEWLTFGLIVGFSAPRRGNGPTSAGSLKHRVPRPVVPSPLPQGNHPTTEA